MCRDFARERRLRLRSDADRLRPRRGARLFCCSLASALTAATSSCEAVLGDSLRASRSSHASWRSRPSVPARSRATANARHRRTATARAAPAAARRRAAHDDEIHRRGAARSRSHRARRQRARRTALAAAPSSSDHRRECASTRCAYQRCCGNTGASSAFEFGAVSSRTWNSLSTGRRPRCRPGGWATRGRARRLASARAGTPRSISRCAVRCSIVSNDTTMSTLASGSGSCVTEPCDEARLCARIAGARMRDGRRGNDRRR